MNHVKKLRKKLYAYGDRNSYFKTDPEAMFTRMKDDAMGSGQLKPGYSVHHGVDSGYIVWLDVGSQPTDTPTLIPFLEGLEKNLSFHYTKVVADAGYENEENYHYLAEKEHLSYIKPADYEKAKTQKYQNDIGRAENMEYDAQSDTYTCHNGKTLKADRVKHEQTKSGYQRETTIYTCEDCKGCPHKKECIKGNHSHTLLEKRNKNLYVSKWFN